MAGASASQLYKYYTYSNSLKINEMINYWEGSILGDKFGYGHGYPTIYEYSWNSSKSVDDSVLQTQEYDLLITILDGKIYTEGTELRPHDDIWIPARTNIQIWTITKKGKVRIIRLGTSTRKEGTYVPVINTKNTNQLVYDKHAKCLDSRDECAVDIISENKTLYDPYIISVFFLQDSEISLHEHPCGAIYYILHGTMCFVQNSEDVVCLKKGESYWTSPENKYKEYSKKNTEIKVLGFQCDPIFFNNYYL